MMTPDICLALIIYMEARGQSHLDQVAVAQVAINRTKADKWPDTICGVMRQKGQYPWLGRTPAEPKAWSKAKRLSRSLLRRSRGDMTGGSVFQCTVGRSCWWEKAYPLLKVTDGHKYYGPERLPIPRS